MEREQVIQTLKQIMGNKILDGAADELDADTPLLELGILDSFSLLQFLAQIETEFGAPIQLESLTLDRVKDLNSLASLVIELCRDRT